MPSHDEAESSGSWIAGSIARALEAGQIEYACEAYEESGLPAADDVLAALKKTPALRDAGARMFLLARDFGRAARLYELSNLWAKAAQQYEEAGELSEAARCWHKGGDTERAAAQYDAAGMHQAAVPLYQKLGNHAAAARCLLASGRALDAAQLYQKLGNPRGELDALRAVQPAHPEHPQAVKRLVQLMVARNRLPDATQVLEGALRDGAVARRDRSLHETLADLYDRQGRTEEAEQVRARLAQRPAGQPTPTPAAPGARVAPARISSTSISPVPAARATATPATAASSTPGSVEITNVSKDAYSFLKAIPIFARLSLEDMKDLYRLTSEASFNPGDTILETGGDGQGLFVVIEGKVDILVVTPAGGVKRLNTLGPGAYFGEVSLLGHSKTSARVAAVTAVNALHIPVDRFEHFLQSRPGAALRVYRLFAENLAERVRVLSSR